MIVASNRKWGLSVPYRSISVSRSSMINDYKIGSYIVVGELSHITLQMYSVLFSVTLVFLKVSN